MGCDIHLYIEYKDKSYERWTSFGGRINPGRIYGMFATMANVRNGWNYEPIAELRGMPKDAGYHANSDNQMYISETDNDEYVNRETADRWVSDGSSVYTDESKCFVTHPDWHSHSWLNANEFEECINTVFRKSGTYAGDFIEYLAVLSVMKEFENHNRESRIVFWFDN